MDPLTLGVGAVSLGLSLFGAFDKYQGAQAQTSAEIAKVGLEEKQDAVRRQAMELSSRRMSLENARKVQQAQSATTAGATAAGAQFGSGLSGATAGESGQGNVNELATMQNLLQGRQMFDLNAQINEQKIKYFQGGGQMNEGAGLSSLGQMLSQNQGTINSFGKQANSWAAQTPWMDSMKSF